MSTSELHANLTLETPEMSAVIEAGSDLSGTLKNPQGSKAVLGGHSTLTASLVATYSASANIPGPDPFPISASLEASAEITATLSDALQEAPTALVSYPTPGSPAAQAGGGGSDGSWHQFTFSIPGKDILKKVRSGLETLVTFLEVIKAILETIKVFLIDFGNPIKAIVEGILRLLNQLFETLKRTGMFAYFDHPDSKGMFKDPEVWKNFGGYKAFINRFKGSLLDARDPNRPQPVSGATQSGFILLVVDSGEAFKMLYLMRQLLRFFGKDFTAPQYAPPVNFKAMPMGDKGDPIFRLSAVFASQPESVLLEWGTPSAQQPPDPGFSDLVTMLGTELYPPKFLIERAEQPVNQELSSDALTVPYSTGTLYHTYESDFEVRGKPNKRANRKVQVVDQYGDPFIKFSSYQVVSLTDTPDTFLLGQLGKFRYIDKNVDFDKTYYYRVRAFSGDLAIDSTSGQVQFNPADLNNRDLSRNVYMLKWPGPDQAHGPVMGRPSAIARVRLSRFPAGFDVVGVLRNLFQTAFSLNFHLAPTPGSVFDSNGNPLNGTSASEVGKGSLQRQGGNLAALVNVPVIGAAAAELSGPQQSFQPNPVTGKLPEQPWQNGRVRRQSARLANTVASALLESGSGAIEQFRAVMQGSPLPGGIPSSKLLTSTNTIQGLCSELTKVYSNSDFTGEEAEQAARLYGDVYADVAYRKNILLAVNFVTSLTLGGSPPDWIKVSVFRDIIPWSGQFLYDMLAKIQALLDAFNGIIKEIKDFIDLLVRKIDAMERFIKYLISILDFIESLVVGAYVLKLPQTSGGVNEWFSAIDNAGGQAPPSGPMGYTAGVALAYVGDTLLASGISAAWNLIF